MQAHAGVIAFFIWLLFIVEGLLLEEADYGLRFPSVNQGAWRGLSSSQWQDPERLLVRTH